MISIREVDTSDPDIVETLTDLHALTFGSSAEQPWYHEGHWWVAYRDDLPVAFCGLTDGGDRTGYLKRAGVTHEARGENLQRRLIRVRERKARLLGWTWMVSDTHHSWASANTLSRCGYRMFWPEDLWAFDTSIYWRKRL